jgi:uncharacterized protein (DUF1800 family)
MAILTYDEAAHLLRRLGFGGPPDEINDLVARGREGAVDYLINYENIDNKAMDDALTAAQLTENRISVSAFAQNWWIARMVLTRRQFEEKMTLFWHNHFATGLSKVEYNQMYVQNQTLRQSALDRFDSLLLKVAQDPAMLVWLDGISNVLGNPNENFGRELQELFSMGVKDLITGEPNYSEKDVREIARAFTGWKFKQKAKSKFRFQLRFFVDPDQHDNTSKEIYGRSGNFSGEDVVSLIAARRATPRFLVNKLFNFFVYPLDLANPDDRSILEKFADVYMTSNHSIKAVVRAIFVSDEFFSDRARFALVKNPIEFVVGPVRMLNATYNPGASFFSLAIALWARAQRMGLELLNPPDVAGWHLNLGWFNTAAMLERYNFANDFANTRLFDATKTQVWLTGDQLKKYTDPSAQKTVENFLSVLGPLKASPDIVQVLTDYLETDDDGNHTDFVVNDATVDKNVRGLLRLALCLPQFQLN